MHTCSTWRCRADVRDRNGWQPEDALQLIFHVFKPLKDTEAQAVKRLVAKLAGEFAKVEFAFLHLSNEHDWGLFDQNSDGHRGRGRRVPERGHAVQVSRSEMLISVTGPHDMKLPLQGLPRPLLLKLHRESTFSDFDYIVVDAGTAGCVLAARLSQDADIRVLLLEAGAGADPRHDGTERVARQPRLDGGLG